MTTIERDDISVLPRIPVGHAAPNWRSIADNWAQVLVDAFTASEWAGQSSTAQDSTAIALETMLSLESANADAPHDENAVLPGASAVILHAWELAGDRLALGALSFDEPASTHGERRSHALTDHGASHVASRPDRLAQHHTTAAQGDEKQRPRVSGEVAHAVHEAHEVHASHQRVPHMRPNRLATNVSNIGSNACSATTAAATVMRGGSAHGSVAREIAANAGPKHGEHADACYLGMQWQQQQPPPLRRIAIRLAASTGGPRTAFDRRRSCDDAAAGLNRHVMPLAARGQGPWLRRVTHAYLSRDGVMLWVRDAHVTPASVGPLVAALSRWAAAMGVRLAAVVCNGKVVFRSASARIMTDWATTRDAPNASAII